MRLHHRLRATVLLFLVLASSLVAACGSAGASPSPTGPAARDLTGTTWRATLVRDVAPLADAPPTIRFDAGQAGGTTGCNTYGGAWTLKPDGTFSVASMVMTEMACDGARGTQEQVVIEILSKATKLEFQADGTIRISGDGGSIVFAEDPR
jgi:heat shock protein HslJ